jgi:hypothetical protein
MKGRTHQYCEDLFRKTHGVPWVVRLPDFYERPDSLTVKFFLLRLTGLDFYQRLDSLTVKFCSGILTGC